MTAAGGFVRRNRGWLAVGIRLGAALAVPVWAGAGQQEYPASLEPQNPGPDGAQALAQVLEQQGVEVDIVRSADALDHAGVGAETTVLVTGTEQLAPSTIRRLRAAAPIADI